MPVDAKMSNSGMKVKIASVSSVGVAICRLLFGRRARQLYLLCSLLIVLFSAAVRIRTFVLTRRIYAVLAGLEKIRVDETTEQQLLKAVPHLIP
jgi:hypothetical protein